MKDNLEGKTLIKATQGTASKWKKCSNCQRIRTFQRLFAVETIHWSYWKNWSEPLPYRPEKRIFSRLNPYLMSENIFNIYLVKSTDYSIKKNNETIVLYNLIIWFDMVINFTDSLSNECLTGDWTFFLFVPIPPSVFPLESGFMRKY